MVDQAPVPGRSPSPPECTGLRAELRQDKAIYMAALKAAETIGEETLKALPGGSILLGLFAGFEHLAEDAENAELSDRVDRLLDIGRQSQDDIAALTALAVLMVSRQAVLLERMEETGVAAEPGRLGEAARAAALTACRGRIAQQFCYADCRGIAGITREEHAASFEFDHVYVQPRLLPEREVSPLRERELLRRMEDQDLNPGEKRRLAEEYAVLTVER